MGLRCNQLGKAWYFSQRALPVENQGPVVSVTVGDEVTVLVRVGRKVAVAVADRIRVGRGVFLGVSV